MGGFLRALKSFFGVLICLLMACVIGFAVQALTPMLSPNSTDTQAYAYEYDDQFHCWISDEDGNVIAESGQIVYAVAGTAEMLNTTGIYIHVYDAAYGAHGGTNTDNGGYYGGGFSYFGWSVTVNGEKPPTIEDSDNFGATSGYLLTTVQEPTNANPEKIYKMIIPSVVEGDQVRIVLHYQFSLPNLETGSSDLFTDVSSEFGIVATPAASDTGGVDDEGDDTEQPGGDEGKGDDGDPDNTGDGDNTDDPEDPNSDDDDPGTGDGGSGDEGTGGSGSGNGDQGGDNDDGTGQGSGTGEVGSGDDENTDKDDDDDNPGINDDSGTSDDGNNDEDSNDGENKQDEGDNGNGSSEDSGNKDTTDDPGETGSGFVDSTDNDDNNDGGSAQGNDDVQGNSNAQDDIVEGALELSDTSDSLDEQTTVSANENKEGLAIVPATIVETLQNQVNTSDEVMVMPAIVEMVADEPAATAAQAQQAEQPQQQQQIQQTQQSQTQQQTQPERSQSTSAMFASLANNDDNNNNNNNDNNNDSTGGSAVLSDVSLTSGPLNTGGDSDSLTNSDLLGMGTVYELSGASSAAAGGGSLVLLITLIALPTIFVCAFLARSLVYRRGHKRRSRFLSASATMPLASEVAPTAA